MNSAEELARKHGYEIWNTGGSCVAFAKRLKEASVGDDIACLDLMITTEGGTDIDGDPKEALWEVGLNYADPRGGESPLNAEGLTLEQAIEEGAKMEARADETWEKSFDPGACSPGVA